MWMYELRSMNGLAYRKAKLRYVALFLVLSIERCFFRKSVLKELFAFFINRRTKYTQSGRHMYLICQVIVSKATQKNWYKPLSTKINNLFPQIQWYENNPTVHCLTVPQIARLIGSSTCYELKAAAGLNLLLEIINVYYAWSKCQWCVVVQCVMWRLCNSNVWLVRAKYNQDMFYRWINRR